MALAADWEAGLAARGCAFATIDGVRACLGEATMDGVCDLQHMGLLAIDADAAVRFAQNYFTNDASRLSAEQAQHSALCNLKGRVVAEFLLVAASPSRLLLWMDRRLVPVVQAFLRPYAIFGKVRLSDLSADYLSLGLLHAGADTARRHADTLGMPLPADADHAVAMTDAVMVVRLPGEPCRHLLLTSAAPAGVQHVPICATSAWMLADIEQGIGRVTPATSEQFLPQMLNLDVRGSVSFNKGCYLGQEIVTRAQHRGEVKRRLLHLGAKAADAVAGDPVSRSQDAAGGTADGPENDRIGTVVNAVSDGHVLQMLAVLPRDVRADESLRIRGAECHLKSVTPAIP